MAPASRTSLQNKQYDIEGQRAALEALLKPSAPAENICYSPGCWPLLIQALPHCLNSRDAGSSGHSHDRHTSDSVTDCTSHLALRLLLKLSRDALSTSPIHTAQLFMAVQPYLQRARFLTERESDQCCGRVGGVLGRRSCICLDLAWLAWRATPLSTSYFPVCRAAGLMSPFPVYTILPCLHRTSLSAPYFPVCRISVLACLASHFPVCRAADLISPFPVCTILPCLQSIRLGLLGWPRPC